jgi:hypothetical protein
MTRLGDWQETYNGIKFWSLDPRPEEVDIYDIAHALANICRYNGHCHKFYSVAQHSVFAAMEANDAGYDIEVVLAALMHDASEAYICDIPRPIKPYLTNYKEIEEHLMACIWEKLGLKVSYEDPREGAILHLIFFGGGLWITHQSRSIKTL